MLKLVSAAAAALAAAVATAASSAAAPSYSPSLSVSFSSPLSAQTSSSSLPYGTPYVVSGCGYSSTYGGVTVVVHSPEAISFAGQMPDSAGCISVSNFSTQGAGHYDVDAYQTVRKKSTRVASTSFDLS